MAYQLSRFKIVYRDFFEDVETQEIFIEAIDEDDAYDTWYDKFNRGYQFKSTFINISAA